MKSAVPEQKNFPSTAILSRCDHLGRGIWGEFYRRTDAGPVITRLTAPLSQEFERVLRDVRAGKPRAKAMRHMADRLDMAGITSFVSTVIQAEKTGANLGPVLRCQSDQRRVERFARAEKARHGSPCQNAGAADPVYLSQHFAVLGFVIITKAILANILPVSLQAPWNGPCTGRLDAH